ncbi:uncharacterized protein [Centruroides vittatus]|uniref:uncharacterized protein n=1 Tax=Centruroides vittatus TaxID=120091 RepID=UPI0035108C48
MCTTADLPAPYINDYIITDSPMDFDLNIYTDGSGINGNTGCAFVVYGNNSEIFHQGFKLDSLCSVFQAELKAIHLAIIWIEEYYNNLKITIYTDCQSAISLINSDKPHPITIAIKKAVLHSSNRYYISWTQGHQGTIGNERADQLAKQAANDNSLQPIYSKLSLSTIKNLLHKDLINCWQSSWSQNHSNSTFNFIPDITTYLNQKITIDPDSIQLITGHGKFSSYLHRFTGKHSPLCAICREVDGPDHYLYRCVCLERDRLAIEITAKDMNIPWPCPHHELINNKDLYPLLQKLAHNYSRIATNTTRD